MSDHEDVLRSLVRELLAEALASGGDEAVSVTNDAELNAFARRVAKLSEQPARREAVVAGTLRFRLADRASASGGAGDACGAGGASRLAAPVAPRVESKASGASGDLRVEAGALTERLVIAAAADGKTVVLGRRAVVTPLALDKARSLGVAVRRETV
jgi:hypothetical protein